jgi:uncharacterized membrane protein
VDVREEFTLVQVINLCVSFLTLGAVLVAIGVYKERINNHARMIERLHKSVFGE